MNPRLLVIIAILLALPVVAQTVSHTAAEITGSGGNVFGDDLSYTGNYTFNGSVGIGTTNPGAKFEVADGASDASDYGSVQITRTNGSFSGSHIAMIKAGEKVAGLGFNPVAGAPHIVGFGAGTTGTFSPNKLSIDLTNSRVGINNVFPSTTLHVNGSARITGLVSCDTIDTDASGNLVCGSDNTGTDADWTGAGTGQMYATNTSDDVGIGTTTPSHRLHVHDGNATVSTATDREVGFLVTPDGSTKRAYLYTSGNNVNHAGYLELYNGASDTTTSHIEMYNAASTTVNRIGNSGYTYFNGGNVGIGTTSPGAKLEVAGQVKITGGTPGLGKVLTSDAVGLATWATPSASSGGWTDDGAVVRLTTISDSVGIGTVSPATTLDVEGGVQMTYGNVNAFLTNITSLGQGLHLQWNRDSGGGASWILNQKGGGAGGIRFGEITGSTVTDTMFISGAGNVGIGTTSPAQKLHVEGKLRLSATETIDLIQMGANNRYGLGVAGGGFTRLYHHNLGQGVQLGSFDGATFTPALTALGNGNVGIGTTNPGQKLDVVGNIKMSGARTKLFYRGDTDAHNGSLAFYSPDSGSTAIITPYDANGNNLATSSIRLGGFGAFDSNTVSLHVSGNVGIGTTSPAQKLHVSGGHAVVSDQARYGSRTAYATMTDSIIPYADKNLRFYDGNSNYHISVWSDTIAHIQGYGASAPSAAEPGTYQNLALQEFGGNVGIGTTSPDEKLQVVGNVMIGETDTTGGTLKLFGTTATAYSTLFTSNGNLHIDAGYGASATGDGMYLNFYNGGTINFGDGASGVHSTASTTGAWNLNSTLYVDGAGKVGIGTASPSTTLHVAGTVRITGGTPAAGQVLTATDATGIATWEPVSSASGLKTFYGCTNTTYSGNLGGYAGGNTKCATAFPAVSGIRMCMAADFINGLPISIGKPNCNTTDVVRYSSFVATQIGSNRWTQDCLGWTSPSHSSSSPAWSIDSTTPWIELCDYGRKLGCCA